jgi:hypothetical protein
MWKNRELESSSGASCRPELRIENNAALAAVPTLRGA